MAASPKHRISIYSLTLNTNVLHVRFLLLVPGLLKSAIQVNDVDADDDEITIIIIHLQFRYTQGKQSIKWHHVHTHSQQAAI